MLKNKRTNIICLIIIALTIIIAAAFIIAAQQGWIGEDSTIGYEDKLFDTSVVHTIDIIMEDWEGFLATCTDEEYVDCTVVIDGESYHNVAIRAKGNTSLTSVASYGNNRYSFKIEFDHYSSGNTYHGLDKLSLNNLISDNTYMKDYLCYQMMNYIGIASPLSSFVYITVNGEDWGLYLAVEGVEESFLQRNYGNDYGELYKPDSMNFGGGRGNGEQFDINDFFTDSADLESMLSQLPDDFAASSFAPPDNGDSSTFTPPGGSDTSNSSSSPDGSDASTSFTPDSSNDSTSFAPPDAAGQSTPGDGSTNSATPSGPSSSQSAEGGGLGAGFGNWGGGGFGSMGSEDVKLQYIDDDPDSYANIFDNAKTDITTADKTRLIESLRKLSAGEDIEQIVDIEAVIKYFVVHTFVCNDDSYTGSMVHNYYLYEENGQLSMIPWDYNLAFGGMGTMGGISGTDNATAEVNSPIDSPVSNGDIESRPMIAWIFDSEEYTELYHQYYQQFISDYFDSGYFSEMLNNTLELISPYVAQDPTAFCSYDEFVTAVDTLKEFCLLRAESVSQQLAGTIPSTEEGQQADNSSLIDASHLSLSAMGEFSNGGKAGEDMTPPGGDSVMPDELNSGNASSATHSAPPGNSSEQTTASDAAQTATDTGETEGLTDDTINSATAPQQSQHPQRTSETANNTAGTGANIFTSAWFWLAISILVLIIGLIVAIRFKR